MRGPPVEVTGRPYGEQTSQQRPGGREDLTQLGTGGHHGQALSQEECDWWSDQQCSQGALQSE